MTSGLLAVTVRRIGVGALALTLSACSAPVSRLPRVAASESVVVTSPAFKDGGSIPSTFTCDGRNVHPPLSWQGGPPAEEFAVVMVDADANEFVHWVAYAIPGRVSEVAAGELPTGTKQGRTSFEKAGYGGPCPPPGAGSHRYVFTVYSLRLAKGATVRPGATLDELVGAIRCCIQARGSLTGTYGR